MNSVDFHDVIEEISGPGDQFESVSLKGGLIHRTWRMYSLVTGKTILLQRINTHVFRNPASLIRNYRILFDHYENKRPAFRMPELFPFRDDSFLYHADNGSCWRLFEFMEGTSEYNTLTPALAGKVAGTFGDFLVAFNDLDAYSLDITIPRFHDLGERYKQFTRTKESSSKSSLPAAAEIADRLFARNHYVRLYEELTLPGNLPLRVMHQDAKLSNILFDENGKENCIVDFDTTMPGYIFSDFGDLVRTAVSVNDESHSNGNAIANHAFYDAVYQNYLQKTGDLLTALEKKYLHFSGIVMTFMQALRFLTDYLSGNKYYNVSYDDQNLDRANNQLLLLESLEQFLQSNYDFRV